MSKRKIGIQWSSILTVFLLGYIASGAISATTLTFDDGAARGLSNGDLAGDAWLDQGVVFTGMRWNAPCGIDAMGCLWESTLSSEMSMAFTQPVSSADFFFSSGPDGSILTATAFSNGTEVGSFSWSDPDFGGAEHVVLSGIGLFDQIVLTGTSSGWNMNDLTFNPIPIPAAVWLFGSALLTWVAFPRRKKTA